LFRRDSIGVNLFLDKGRSLLIDFASRLDRDSAVRELTSLPLDPHSLVQESDAAQFLSQTPWHSLWSNGRLSNYEYLLIVNHIAGRAFGDLDRYPVFPWILRSYSAESDGCRDLSQTLQARTLARHQVLAYLQLIEPFATIAAAESIAPASSLGDFFRAGSPDLAVPEFFACPELLTAPAFSIPEWSASPLDFVYRHRRHLESPFVTAQIPFFISTVFSIPHPPPRVRRSTPLFTEPVQYYVGVSRAIAAIIAERAAAGFDIYIAAAAVVHHVALDEVHRNPGRESFAGSRSTRGHDRRPSGPASARTVAQSLTVGTQKRTPMPPLSADSWMVAMPGGFVLANATSALFRVLDVDGRGGRELDSRLRKVRAIATDGDWAAVGGAALVLFKSGERMALIQVYRDLVSAVAVSEKYGVAIAGTNDGALVVVSLARLSMVRAIELDGLIPRKIEITGGWGFFVTYGHEIVCGSIRHYIVVHNVNGVFVRKVELGVAIDCWFSWASWDGFDFLAMAGENGKIETCEVYELHERKSVYNCQTKIVALYYSKNHALLVAASVAGQLFFIPCVVP
jgi:hypothetical protein